MTARIAVVEAGKLITGLALAALVLLGDGHRAWGQSPGEVAGLLRVESESGTDKWGPRRLVGYIYNDSTFKIGSVRLRLETLDPSDRVIGETLAWVYVSVPARSRAYFSVRRPTGGDAFRLTVESFVLISREATGETP